MNLSQLILFKSEKDGFSQELCQLLYIPGICLNFSKKAIDFEMKKFGH